MQCFVSARFLKWVFCLLCLHTVLLSYGQRRYTFFAGAGTSYYYGDLTDRFNTRLLRPAGNLGLSAYVLPKVSLRFSISHGQVGSADSLASAPDRRARNLHFRSPVTEGAAVIVYELIRDRFFDRRRQMKRPFISPYVFAGVSIFRFDPQAQLDGDTWLTLQPLGTEGQYIQGVADTPEPYRRVQMALPFGGGLEMRFANYLGARVELGYRTTFTDYLDDISSFYPEGQRLAESRGPEAVALSYRGTGSFPDGAQRGSPSVNDSYFFGMISLVYYLSAF